MEYSEYNTEVSYQRGCQNVQADALSRLASILPSCKTLHGILAHPGITRLYEYFQRHKVPISLEEAKRVTENCKTCGLWKPRFLRPPSSDLIRSSKPWERLSIDFVGPEPMTRSKNQYLLTVVDEFSRFLFALPLRNITSSSVIKCLLTLFAIFGTLGSFTSTGSHSSSHRNSKTSAAKMELRPPKLRPTTSGQWPKRNCVMPFSAFYTPQTAHSLTGSVSYYQRSRRFGQLSVRSPKKVPMIAAFVSNAANR